MVRKKYPSLMALTTLDEIQYPYGVNAGGGGGGGGKGGSTPDIPPPPPPAEKPVAAKPVAETATSARQAQREKATKAAGIKGSILTGGELAESGTTGKSLLGQ